MLSWSVVSTQKVTQKMAQKMTQFLTHLWSQTSELILGSGILYAFMETMATQLTQQLTQKAIRKQINVHVSL